MGTGFRRLCAELSPYTHSRSRGKDSPHTALGSQVSSWLLFLLTTEVMNSSHAIPMTQDPGQGALLERTGLAFPL